MIQSARQRIAVTPSNRQKVYPGLSLEKQIERAGKDGRPLLGAQTQTFYTDTLRDMLKVAARKKLIRFNPAADVRPLKRETLAPEERRRPFSPAQLSDFFRGAFYLSCLPGADQPYTQANRPWRFWLPLIMLFSGARPGEVLQLSIKDVKRTAAGTWFFDLMNEDGTKSLKTSTSRRRVPIHSELIRLGVLEFVEKRKKAAEDDGARLFTGIKPDKYGSLTDVPSKAFNRTFLRAEIKLEARQALYSLRHNVRDALRRCKAPPEALRHIAGWGASKEVSDHYGEPGSPDLMAEWMEKIDYPGLDLTFLHGAGGKV
jgi:integrase